MNKTCQLNLRLTSAELEQLRAKSKSYKNLSSYIIHTCLNADDKLTINKLNFLESWADSYITYKNDLSFLNNNLNQMVKYLYTTNVIGQNIQDEIKYLLKSIIKLQEEISESNYNILSIYKTCISKNI